MKQQLRKCEIANNRLFNTVLKTRTMYSIRLLPPVKLTPYDLRTRSHNHSLPRADNKLRKNFIYRLLYKNIYKTNIPLLLARIFCYYLCFVHVRQSCVNKVSTIQYNTKRQRRRLETYTRHLPSPSSILLPPDTFEDSWEPDSEI